MSKVIKILDEIQDQGLGVQIDGHRRRHLHSAGLIVELHLIRLFSGADPGKTLLEKVGCEIAFRTVADLGFQARDVTTIVFPPLEVSKAPP